MSRRLRISLACIFFSLLSVAMVAQDRPTSTGQNGGQATAITANDLFAEIGRMAPGFGGIFVDEKKRTLNVYLAGSSPDFAITVDKAINDVLGRSRPKGYQLVVLKGEYTFLQLREWHDRVTTKILAIPGAVQTGIDHRTNRIQVGMETLELKPKVSAVLDGAGVPREAVNIERMPTQHLQDLSSTAAPQVEEPRQVNNDAVC